MIYNYVTNLLPLQPKVYTPYATQIYAILYNLLLIDQAAGKTVSIIEKVLQLTEYLLEGVEAPHVANLNNSQLMHLIGNHFPKKMKHCLKCRVCNHTRRTRGQNGNCRKSKYVCEGCSDFFDQKVHLCVECFKKFHAKIGFFVTNRRRGTAR